MYSEKAIEEEELQHHHIQKWQGYTREEDSIVFDCITDKNDKVEICINVLDDNILRFQLIPSSVERTDSQIPIHRDWQKPDFSVKDAEFGVIIETESLTCRVEEYPWKVSVTDPDGELLCEEAIGDIDAHKYRRSLLPGYTTNFKGEIVGVNESFRLDPEESFYGLGEKFTGLDKREQTITCKNKNPYGSGTEEAHKNIPFLLSSKGYGLFLNSTFKNVWELGSRSNMAYSIYTEEPALDMYFIYGDSMKSILDEYTDITGKPPMPPKWSFGLQHWSFSEEGKFVLSQEGVEDLAKQLRSEGLPYDMIFLTTSSWNELFNEKYDMKFDRDRYPHPKEFRKTLDNLNLKLIGSIMPFLPVGSEIYKEAKENGFLLQNPDGSPSNEPVFHQSHLSMIRQAKEEGEIKSDRTTPAKEFIKEQFDRTGVTTHLEDIIRSYKWRWKGKEDYYGPGGFVDFTDPDAVEWWQDKIVFALEQEGFDGFMTDFAEETPVNAVYHNGKTGKEMYNYYSTLYQRANFKAFEKSEKDPFVRARSGYAGLQKYPTCWPGDPNPTFNAMACVLRGGLNLGLSGVPFWMNYIGAHTGKPSEELFARWSQCAMFASHTDPGVNNPLSYPEHIFEIYKKYANLRYQLLPYIYSYAHRATETGIPLIRAMVLEFEDDPRTHEVESQFMFGEEFLVAPILKESADGSGVVSRNIYLPEGEWIEYWSGEKYDGQTTITYEATLDKLPLFVKNDSIVPMIDEKEYIGDQSFDPVTLDVYLDSNATFTLHDDEPVSIECSKTASNVVVDIGESTKDYRIKFNTVDNIESVTLNDEQVIEYSNETTAPDAGPGWWNDEENNTWITFQGKETGSHVEVSTK